MSRLLGYVLFVLIAPPLVAGLWYVLAGVWSNVVYAGRVPEGTARRRGKIFRYILFGFYAYGVIFGLIAHVF